MKRKFIEFLTNVEIESIKNLKLRDSKDTGNLIFNKTISGIWIQQK